MNLILEEYHFLHDRPWMLPWIKSISEELDITIHVIASQMSGHCDVMSNRLWLNQQNKNQASETQGWCVKIVVFIVIYFMDLLCHVRNNIMYVLSWQTVSALTQLLFGYLHLLLLRNPGNKHQITLIWALKQFVTRVHTLFSIFMSASCGLWNSKWKQSHFYFQYLFFLFVWYRLNFTKTRS